MNQPTPRQILCHNFLQAFDGVSIRLDIVAADPQTSMFTAHLLTGVADFLGINSLQFNPAGLVDILQTDMFDLIHAAEALAYNASGRIPASPYQSMHVSNLRTLLIQSPYTLWHYMHVSVGIVASPAPNVTRLEEAIRSYFNTRYETAIHLINSYPLSPGEAAPLFFNRPNYEHRMLESGVDVVM